VAAQICLAEAAVAAVAQFDGYGVS
jgi:hypothetical protein